MPRLREMVSVGNPITSLAGGLSNQQLISPDRCKKFPDRVLFYIFYSMPYDKAQFNASIELKKRDWMFCNDSMRWMKAQPSQQNQSVNASRG